MLVLTIIAIVVIFVGAGFSAPTPLGEHLVWSLIAAAFPVSLVSLIAINLKGTLARRLKSISEQIDAFKLSLQKKLADERLLPADEQDEERIKTWETNLSGLEQQRQDLTSQYQMERFRGSVAFLAAVYTFGFFFALNKQVPLAGFGTLQAYLERVPDTVIAALLGAWAFALYSVIARISTADQTPQFFLRLSYQPILACALAHFATFVDEQNFLLLVAFGIGFLPYPELVRWLRLKTNRYLGGGKAAEEGGESGHLSEICGIGFDEIDRLHEENIKNIQQLAFSNPLVTHFVTAFPLKTIIDWTDQAILRIYVDRDTADKLRPLGIRGAIEMAQVRRRIRELEQRSKEAAAEGDTEKAAALKNDISEFMAAVAEATGTSAGAVRNLAYQLGEDPHIEFIYFLYDELASSS